MSVLANREAKAAVREQRLRDGTYRQDDTRSLIEQAAGMFLHLEIGSSKPIEVKTKTRGLEKSGKNAEGLLAPESTDKARKSIKDWRTNLDRNFVVCFIDAKKDVTKPQRDGSI